MRRTESIQQVQRWFLQKVAQLWPVAAGSLSLRHSPCIRPSCPACARGEGHASYALYGRRRQRRFSVYVPEPLVPAVQRAVDHGWQLQELVREAGWRYTRALKAERSLRRRASKPRRKDS